MDSSNITTDQAAQLRDRIGPMLQYLHSLKSRIEQRRFPPGDKLRRDVERAHEALQFLYVELHYLSCKSGVGRPPRE